VPTVEPDGIAAGNVGDDSSTVAERQVEVFGANVARQNNENG
jgi:hypothetical protein